MTKEQEKILKKLQEMFKDDPNVKMGFLDENGNIPLSEEEQLEEKSNDLFDEAMSARSRRKRKSLLDEAIKVYPKNIDARLEIAMSEELPIKKFEALDKLALYAKEILEEKNMFKKDNIGSFWQIFETRPYMRVIFYRAISLEKIGSFSEAIAQYEEILKLNESDNLGARYCLCANYLILEQYDKLKDLLKKYDEESNLFRFAKACMAYKMRDYKTAKSLVRKIHEANEHIYSIFVGEEEMENNPQYYSLGTSSEASAIINQFNNLLSLNTSFIDYYTECIDYK